jgi:hypothetical protein
MAQRIAQNDFQVKSKATARLQRRSRFQPLESKFHRDSDFETPVAVFILQVERYAVATRIAVGWIERDEAIDHAFVDCALKYLIRLITKRRSVCRH